MVVTGVAHRAREAEARKSATDALKQQSAIVPLIGGIRLRELTVIDVEDALDDLARRGLGRSTIAGTRNALAAVLQDAVRARHLSANLARMALLPEDAAPPSETSYPTSAQVVELLDAAVGTRLEYLLVVLATTGTRIGEALGAQWGDLDLEVGTWTVARTTTLDAAGKITLGQQPKANGSRVIVLPPGSHHGVEEPAPTDQSRATRMPGVGRPGPGVSLGGRDTLGPA